MNNRIVVFIANRPRVEPCQINGVWQPIADCDYWLVVKGLDPARCDAKDGDNGDTQS
jgi:hypothetical protein